MIRKKYIMDAFCGYAVKEVINILSFISKEERDCLYKEYTFIKNDKSEIELTESEIMKNKRTIKLMKTYMNMRARQVTVEKNNQKPYKNFFSIFIGSSKEDVLKVVSTLRKEEKTLLYKKYGTSLTSIVVNPNLTEEENKVIGTIIIKKIKHRLYLLRNGSVIITIEDLFKPLTMQEIRDKICLLTEREQAKMYKLFGPNLNDKIFIQENSISNLVSESSKCKMLGKPNPNRLTTTPYKDFFSLFESERRPNETDAMLKKRVLGAIKPEYMPPLIKKYGSDLLHPNFKGSMTTEESRQISGIIYCIKYFMNKDDLKYYKSLMSRMIPLTTFEEVLEEINTFTEIEKSYLKLMFQSDYKGVSKKDSISSSDLRKIKDIINIIQKRILKRKERETGISVAILRKLNYLLETQEGIYLQNQYGINTSLAILMNKYLSDYVSLNQISYYTGVGISTIVSLTLEHLMEEREEIISSFSKIETKLKTIK